MRKLNEYITKMQIKAICAISEFKNSERGDTNFISMLLIIGIVVVLAGLFLTLGKDVMETIKGKVMEFLNSLS